MESVKSTIKELLFGTDHCLMMPAYQREYSWTRARWQALISDISYKVINNSEKKHWIGIFLLAKSEDRCPRDLSSLGHKDLDVIDGQQRILTLTIWLMALKDHAAQNNIVLPNFDFVGIQGQETDQSELIEIKENRWRLKWKTFGKDSSGILHAYYYFRWILWLGKDAIIRSEPIELPKKQTGQYAALNVEDQWARSLEQLSRNAERDEDTDTSDLILARSQQLDLKNLLEATLNELQILVLYRDENDEPSSELFEALNGKRQELDQFDYLRNYIFTGIKDKTLRNQIYSTIWQDTELVVKNSGIEGIGGVNALNLFLYDFMISLGESRWQSRINSTKTSSHFTKFFESNRNIDENNNKRDHARIAKEVLLPSVNYWVSVKKFGESFSNGTNQFELPYNIKRNLQLIHSLTSGPLTPLLMNSVKNFFEQRISEVDLEKQIEVIRNYVARLVIINSPLSPLRASVMAILGNLGSAYSTVDLKNQLNLTKPNDELIREKLMPSNRGVNPKYPDSAQLSQKGNLYPRQILAILQGLEYSYSSMLSTNILGIGQDSSEVFTLEHIYPQNGETIWRPAMTRHNIPTSAMQNRIHVLGNLAVVPKRMNSRLGNRSFTDKKSEMIAIENNCPDLKINRQWLSHDKWVPEIIDQRTESLVDQFLNYYN